jgi:hypothetical protein
MKTSRLCVVFAMAVVLLGCEHDHFVVEVTPDGETFQRKLTCWHLYGEGDKEIRPLAPEKLTRIGKLYEKTETVEGGKKHLFTGRFTGQTPADVGGAGSYTHFTSPLGSTSSYVERFRGSDDLEAELSQRRAAADQLTDLAIGWLESELGQQPGFEQLKKFLDRDLRQDLKNLALYGWAGDAMKTQQSDLGTEFLLRAAQYLCERGYASPKDAPGLARAAFSEDPAPLLKHLQRLVARKMGLPADRPLPDALAFLSDPQRLRASWNKYGSTTELFQKRLKKWKEEKQTDPNATQPTPEDLLIELVGQLVFEFRLFAADDTLELKLHSGQKPYATNGQWDEQAASLSWSEDLRHDAPLPVFCFALWSQPERAFQEAHFGKVLLSGEELAEYVLWYRGLDSREAGEWDRFIAGCKPGADLKPALETFRFSGDRQPDPNKPDEKPASLADTPRGLILAALQAAQEQGSRGTEQK